MEASLSYKVSNLQVKIFSFQRQKKVAINKPAKYNVNNITCKCVVIFVQRSEWWHCNLLYCQLCKVKMFNPPV